MKYIVVLTILYLPLFLKAQQKEKFGGTYAGVMLHDTKPGASFLHSFGINKSLGIGIGADITSYATKVLVPLYADVRLAYTLDNTSIFGLGQIGKPFFKLDPAILISNSSGQTWDASASGQVFYGGGVGGVYRLRNIGFFLSYAYRYYRFKYNYGYRGGEGLPSHHNDGMSVITGGVVF